jgi:rhodanese-related sulfurtransferase/DNA-binding transcriptional ArsR family regulator
MADHKVKAELFDQFARIGQALSSGRRIEILDVLANGERSVEGVAEQVGLSLANASRHLQLLREAGLVSSRREGTFIRYRLAAPEVYEFWTALRSLANKRLAEVERLVEAYIGSLDGLEAVTREELYGRLSSGDDLFVIDVRPGEEFAAGHLPSAVSIPLEELKKRLHQVPKDREVVAYCRGPYCAFAPEAVAHLRAEGYRARQLEDGLPEWAAAGLPVEAGGGVRTGRGGRPRGPAAKVPADQGLVPGAREATTAATTE